jgi:phosphoribosyl-ATP pyrophosphohydrolase
MPDPDVIERLERVIQGRLRERPEGSYVVRLLTGGEPELARKIREEAGELIEARPGSETVRETADLVFHILVLLALRGVPFASVCEELERRFGVGGLAEKAGRTPRADGA